MRPSGGTCMAAATSCPHGVRLQQREDYPTQGESTYALETALTSAIAWRQLRRLDGDGSGEDGKITGMLSPPAARAGEERCASSGCAKGGVRTTTSPSKRGSLLGVAASSGLLQTAPAAGDSLGCLISLFLRSSHEQTLKKSIGSETLAAEISKSATGSV
jgi:hypothetical protein